MTHRSYIKGTGGESRRVHHSTALQAMTTTASLQSTRLANGNVLIIWTHSSAHCIQVYREVGTNSPEDKGAVLWHRELPLTATEQEIQSVADELTA